MFVYKPREKNVIQEILQDHLSAFEESYEHKYSKKYGKYKIIRIKESVERLIECGDYSKGIARIKCTNPAVDTNTSVLSSLRSKRPARAGRLLHLSEITEDE